MRVRLADMYPLPIKVVIPRAMMSAECKMRREYHLIGNWNVSVSPKFTLRLFVAIGRFAGNAMVFAFLIRDTRNIWLITQRTFLLTPGSCLPAAN